MYFNELCLFYDFGLLKKIFLLKLKLNKCKLGQVKLNNTFLKKKGKLLF